MVLTRTSPTVVTKSGHSLALQAQGGLPQESRWRGRAMLYRDEKGMGGVLDL